MKKKYQNLVGRLTDDEYRALCPQDRPSLKRLTDKEYRELQHAKPGKEIKK